MAQIQSRACGDNGPSQNGRILNFCKLPIKAVGFLVAESPSGSTGLHSRNAGEALSRKRVKSQDERGHPFQAASLRISDVRRLANLQKGVAFSD